MLNDVIYKLRPVSVYCRGSNDFKDSFRLMAAQTRAKLGSQFISINQISKTKFTVLYLRMVLCIKNKHNVLL